MSQFILYKSRKKSLRQIGLIDRVVYFLATIALPVLAVSGILIRELGVLMTIWFIIAALWGLFLITLVFYSRYVNKSLEKLGDVEVTLNGIKKSISGIETVFDYKQIRKIRIKDHIRSIFFPENKDGSKTYVVSITDKNNEEEVFVISSQSVSHPRVNFLDSLKYIEKYKSIKLNINRK